MRNYQGSLRGSVVANGIARPVYDTFPYIILTVRTNACKL